jgi:hypothetical protein
MKIAKSLKKGNFYWGLLCGGILGVLMMLILFPNHPAQAGKPTQIDIIYKIVAQNYYLIQKSMAYQQTNLDVLLQITEKNKVKNEKILPLTNRLQQESFALDLKLKELNE